MAAVASQLQGSPPGLLRRCPLRITGSTALVLQASYWAIRLFCSTLTRLSVQKVQPEP